MSTELALIILMGLVFAVLVTLAWLIVKVAELTGKVERLEQRQPVINNVVGAVAEPFNQPTSWPTFPSI